MADCGFQTDAFQQNAFQMCVPVPPTPVVVGGRGYGRMRIAQYPVPLPEDDEAVVAMLLELLDE